MQEIEAILKGLFGDAFVPVRVAPAPPPAQPLAQPGEVRSPEDWAQWHGEQAQAFRALAEKAAQEKQRQEEEEQRAARAEDEAERDELLAGVELALGDVYRSVGTATYFRLLDGIDNPGASDEDWLRKLPQLAADMANDLTLQLANRWFHFGPVAPEGRQPTAQGGDAPA